MIKPSHIEVAETQSLGGRIKRAYRKMKKVVHVGSLAKAALRAKRPFGQNGSSGNSTPTSLLILAEADNYS